MYKCGQFNGRDVVACRYSDYREFTCPLCRKRTQLPVGGVKKLADNFLVSSLSELVGRQRPSKYPFCDICKLLSGKHRDATSKCLDCAKLLCAGCVQLHKQTKVEYGSYTSQPKPRFRWPTRT